MTVPKPPTRDEQRARQDELMATQDTFSDEFGRWMAAVAREHCDNFLSQLGQPKEYGELLFMVTEATKAAVLWCVHDLKMDLPLSEHASDEEVEKRTAERDVRRQQRETMRDIEVEDVLSQLRGAARDQADVPSDRAPGQYL